MTNAKPKIMITFNAGGENGGPYNSHKRIVESGLKDTYEFIPLVIPKGRRGLLNLRLQRNLVRQIRKQRPDMVQFTGLALDGFHTLLACKLARVENTLLVVRGSVREAVEFYGVKRRVAIWLENWTLKHASACYGVSRYVENWDCVQRYGKKNMGHIYNFPAVPAEKASAKDIRRQYGIQQQDVLVLSTGRITEEKGFADLTDVILQFAGRPHVKFVIVGAGGYLQTMQTRLKAQIKNGQVFLPGYQKNVQDYLYAADIFTILTWHETLGNSVLEASQAGLPVVAAGVGGVPEIIDDQETGLLVKPRDIQGAYEGLLRLAEDPGLREEMGRKGREKIQTVFNREQITEKIDAVYKQILGK